jgi:hypothetical protein
MCYSAEVSLGTFTFVALGAAFLWMRDKPLDRAIGLLLLSVALMQLVEFFLWKNVECGPANTFWTRMLPIALLLQPLLCLFIAWQFKAGWAPFYKEFFFITLLLCIPLVWQFWTSLDSCTTLDEHGHLVWPKTLFTLSPLAYWLYWFGTVYVFATLKDTPFSVLTILFYSMSSNTSKLFYPKSWPSIWCHFVNALTVFAIARPALKGVF